jgi:tetratricopeptide (TPR) repeat protein
MKAGERHHLKQNEFVQTTAKVVETFQANRDRYTLIAGIAAVVLLLGGGWMYWNKHTNDLASARLGIGLATEQAQIVPAPTLPGATQAPGTYPTEQARDEAALKVYQSVIADYPSTPAGLTARYQSAVLFASMGRTADADAAFQAIANDSKSTVYGAPARLGHAQMLLQSGRLDDAIKALTDLSAERDGVLPVDGVLMQLAHAYLKAGKTAEARATFKRVVDEFTQSPYATEARQQLTSLG